MALKPRVVLVTRQTEYSQLLNRHGTHQQVAFFLRSRERAIEEVQARHLEQESAVQTVMAAIPVDWRRTSIDRSDLDRWLFSPEDLVIAIGQDGLVANAAKYLSGQSVLGVNPSGDHNAGVLVPHDPAQAASTLRLLAADDDGLVMTQRAVSERAMVNIETEAGHRLNALNEIFIGQRTHQSARYHIRVGDGPSEFQSSSGLLISSGTGSSGWSRSLWTERHCNWPLPSAEAADLAWFVREAWPSVATQTTLVEGVLQPGEALTVVAASDALVAFGDGIEQDRIELSWGQTATVSLSDQRLRLLVPGTA